MPLQCVIIHVKAKEECNTTVSVSSVNVYQPALSKQFNNMAIANLFSS